MKPRNVLLCVQYLIDLPLRFVRTIPQVRDRHRKEVLRESPLLLGEGGRGNGSEGFVRVGLGGEG